MHQRGHGRTVEPLLAWQRTSPAQLRTGIPPEDHRGLHGFRSRDQAKQQALRCVATTGVVPTDAVVGLDGFIHQPYPPLRMKTAVKHSETLFVLNKKHGGLSMVTICVLYVII